MGIIIWDSGDMYIWRCGWSNLIGSLILYVRKDKDADIYSRWSFWKSGKQDEIRDIRLDVIPNKTQNATEDGRMIGG